MFNKETYNLLLEVLRSDIDPKSKTEIVKFYTLPRNTPVRPMVELPDEEQYKRLGTTKRPTGHDLKRKANPEMAAEEDAVKETLKGRL